VRVSYIVNKRQLRCVVVETAQAVMDTRGHDPEVRLQVEDLIGSLGDTLPDERVLQELEALKACGPTFQEILADFPTLAD
jgi:uncharacterized protein (DUF433 family)